MKTMTISNEGTGEEFVSLDSIKGRYIEIVWRACDKNITRTANTLRTSRKLVYRHLWRMGLFTGSPRSGLDL